MFGILSVLPTGDAFDRGALPQNSPETPITHAHGTPMIIKDQRHVTEAVLAEVQRAEDPRFREIVAAAVRHLHDFAREVKLTEEEFQRACAFIAELGQRTNEAHNEVVLLSGSLGFSTLVCLLNNGDAGQTDTTANLLGPFWRADSPPTKNGESIVRSPTPGPALFVNAWVRDAGGQPVAAATVDVWHSSPEGFYENQDPGQAEMNLRGTFTTDENGRISFRTVKPVGYPIPVDGPVGTLIRALRRHNMRPAHLHFLICKPGYKTHISQVYVNDDVNLDTDVQFGVTSALVGNYVRHEGERPPAPDVEGPWYSLDFTFIVEPGTARLPRPPITAKAVGERPQLEILKRA
jgi:hydroxyquinol 1,2-dioxygenase